jgi:hypothetical protein
LSNAKHCYKCGYTIQSEYVFCPACGTDAIALEQQVVKSVKERRNFRRAIGFLVIPMLLLGFGVGFTVAPWFQNLSANLESKDVRLELQVGNESSNWLYSTSTFRAKVSLPNNLSDSATVELERLEGEIWVEQDSKEVTESATVPLQYKFSTAGKQSVRVSLYSGSKLIQASNMKTVQGVKAPNGPLNADGKVYYRPFTETEYDTVSTPGCGSRCWAYFVTTPTRSTLTLWVHDSALKVLSKKVEVTITKVGVLKKVVLPSLGFGNTSSLHVESRPATAEEIQEANKPKPKPTPLPNNNGGGTPSGCERLSVLLERKEAIDRWILLVYPESALGGHWLTRGASEDMQTMERMGELWKIEAEIKRCY